MYRSKKGASEGSAVAVIIIVIALFMTLYILFIPPEEREKLLEQNISDSTIGSYDKTFTSKMELLAESPGYMTPTTEFATVHRIPSVNVFLREEPKITTLAPNLLVSKGLFSESSPQVRFKTEDLDETIKVNLFFSVDKPSGEIRVVVNGNTVYTEEIETSGVKVIEIAKSYLKENNKLELKVSSPGIVLWKTNKYNLKDVRIKQEFERRNNEETRTFTIPENERESLIKIKLRYHQQCNFPLENNQLTRFDVFVNERRAHSSDIRCITTEDEIEIDPDLVVEGTNTMTFRLEKGDFSFNLIRLETESRKSERPTYFFSLTGGQYEDIKSRDRKIDLNLLLDSNAAFKNARILINNNEILMQTDKTSFERNLKDYVLEGTNFIKIVPINSFNVVGLKVTLE